MQLQWDQQGPNQLVDARYIYGNKYAFAALKADGSVVAWGASGFYGNAGGDCSKVQCQLVDVQYIYATNFAFAALKANGSVVSWGSADKVYKHGEWTGEMKDLGFSKVQAQLGVDVQSIYSTESDFAALKADGTVVAWGNQQLGGDCTAIQDQLVDVQSIYSTE